MPQRKEEIRTGKIGIRTSTLWWRKIESYINSMMITLSQTIIKLCFLLLATLPTSLSSSFK
eukprot:g73421.t1